MSWGWLASIWRMLLAVIAYKSGVAAGKQEAMGLVNEAEIISKASESAPTGKRAVSILLRSKPI